MFNILNRIAFTVLFSFPLMALSGGISQQNAKDKMMADLDMIKNTFDVRYAPADWKKIYANWDLQSEIDRAKVKILETPDITVKDYQRIVLDFFLSTQDYHVRVHFYSTEMAFLPFRLHGSNGRYYVAWVMEPFFVGTKRPLKKGDEILTFNGQPIDELIQELKKTDFGNPSSATDQALAEAAFTLRSGTAGHIVPSGPVTLTVRHPGSTQVSSYHLKWFYLPEEILSSISPMGAAVASKLLQTEGINFTLAESGPSRTLGEHSIFYKDMSTPLYKQYKKSLLLRTQALNSMIAKDPNLASDAEDHYIGSKKGFVPNLGKITWEAAEADPFHAYIYKDRQGRNIGYVRIPHYNAGSQSAQKFAELMKRFQQKTDALVVDQVHNPGGNMFYMYALASMLTDQPLFVPDQKMAVTQEDVFFAVESVNGVEQVTTDEEARKLLGSNLAGYPVDLDLARSMAKYFRFIIKEWKDGRQLTDPGYIYGVDYLKPHPLGHYSKPLLVLVNELDFSCGDFLPAILQDNHRATILGRRTSGAGGYVLNHTYPNLFGIREFSYTGSIAQRLDSNPIENLGVIPDIVLEITQKDLERNYVDYVSQIHKAMNALLSN